MKKFTAVLAAIILTLAVILPIYAADYQADSKKTLTGSGQVSGPCHLLAVNVYGITAADNIGIYDYSPLANSYGTAGHNYIGNIVDLEFEMGVSANKSSTYMDARGATFTYGVYIQSSATTAITTVLYDY